MKLKRLLGDCEKEPLWKFGSVRKFGLQGVDPGTSIVYMRA